MIEVLASASATASVVDASEMPWTSIVMNFTVPAGTQLLLGVLAGKALSGQTLGTLAADLYVRDNVVPVTNFTRLHTAVGTTGLSICLFGWEDPPEGTQEYRGLWYYAAQATLGLIAVGGLNRLVTLNNVDGVRAANLSTGLNGTSAAMDYSAQPASDVGLFACARAGSGAMTADANQTTIIDKLSSESAFRLLITSQRLKIDNSMGASWVTSAAYAMAGAVLVNPRVGGQVIITE